MEKYDISLKLEAMLKYIFTQQNTQKTVHICYET